MFKRFSTADFVPLGLLALLVFSTIFERFNVFLPEWGFSLKLSLIILPIAALVLLFQKRLRFNPTFLFPFLALVILVEALSIIFSFDRFQSFQVVVFHLLMLGLFYLIIWSTRSERDLDRLVWTWGAGAATVALLGIWQFARYAGGWDPTLPFDRWFAAKTLPAGAFVQTLYEWLNLTFLRPSSTFIDVSTGASFSGIFLLLGLGWFLSWDRNDRRRLVIAVPLIFSALYFLVAVSRSAALGLVAGLAVFAYLNLKDRVDLRVLKRWLEIGLGLILAGGVFFSLGSAERWASTLTRLNYLRAAGEMFKHNPILGVGAGNFEPYYVKIVVPGAPAGYSHSIFLTWLGETGILGLAANLLLTAVLVFFLWTIVNSLKNNPRWYRRMAGLLAALVALVFANLFHAHYGLEFTWVLMGLAVSGYYLAKEKEANPKGLKFPTLRVDVLGVKVDNVTMEEALERVKEIFRRQAASYRIPAMIFTPNPEMIMSARKDKEFTQLLNKADLAVPDGVGLVWASRIWGTPFKERVAGTDLFLKLCGEVARRGGQVFLLEDPAGLQSAAIAAKKLKCQYPKLNVKTLVAEGSPAGDAQTVSAINQVVKSSSRPIDLLFVAYGHGKQERWIARNLDKIPVKIAMGVGGAFDFVAGSQTRAPFFLRCLGLEWLYRLVRQPWRIKRQLQLLPFIYLTFRESFRSG